MTSSPSPFFQLCWTYIVLRIFLIPDNRYHTILYKVCQGSNTGQSRKSSSKICQIETKHTTSLLKCRHALQYIPYMDFSQFWFWTHNWINYMYLSFNFYCSLKTKSHYHMKIISLLSFAHVTNILTISISFNSITANCSCNLPPCIFHYMYFVITFIQKHFLRNDLLMSEAM